MKSIEAIDLDIEMVEAAIQDKRSCYKKHIGETKKLEKLLEIKRYALTLPNEAFIKEDLTRLKVAYENKMNGYAAWLNSGAAAGIKESGRKSAFKTENGIPLIQAQIKTYEYLLG